MSISEKQRRPVVLRLCAPSGFCAGVDRAVQTVVLALKKYGAPVYVRHEIVHNKYVVEGLRNLGAVFVNEFSEIPAEDHARPVILSAHGVSKEVYKEVEEKKLLCLDATCPLVSRVHKQALRHHKAGRHVLLIGHAGHPEVAGTMGQLPEGSATLIETKKDIANLNPSNPEALGYVSQTTLSIEDTAVLIDYLKELFPKLHAPTTESICYATTNRQEAVKKSAVGVDMFLIVGAPNSSNSQRLVEIAERAGGKTALLIERAGDIPWSRMEDMSVFALSAGASAPEILVNEIISAFQQRFEVKLDLEVTVVEEESFPVVHELRGTNLTLEDMSFIHGSL